MVKENEIVVNMYNTIFSLAIKKNGIMTFSRKWIQLENITLNKISHIQKYHIFMQNLNLKLHMCTGVCVYVCMCLFICVYISQLHRFFFNLKLI